MLGIKQKQHSMRFSQLIAWRKSVAEFQAKFNVSFPQNTPKIFQFGFFLISRFALIGCATVIFIIEIPLHFRFHTTELFSSAARRNDQLVYLESYTNFVRRSKLSFVTVALTSILIVSQFVIAGYSVYQIGKPRLVSAAGSNFIAFWDGAGSPPSGWSCISCSPGDDLYQLLPRGNGTYGGTGGGATQTHTMSLVNTTQNLDSGVSTKLGGAAGSGTFHEMTGLTSPSVSSVSSLPAYRTIKVIRYDTPGNPTTIPSGVIIPFDTAPSGSWTRYTSQDGKYIYGGSDASTTGGSDTVTYTFSGTVSTPDTADGFSGATAPAMASSGHTHTFSGTTDPVDHQPLRVEVLLYKATATVATPSGVLGLWNGTPPSGWTVASNGGQTFSQQYLRGSSAYTTGGGSATQQPNDTTVTSSAPIGSVNRNTTSAQVQSSSTTHTHDVSVTFDVTSNAPPYRDVIIAKKDAAGSVTVSGRIFTDEGTTGLDCSTPRTVSLRVNGAGSYSTSCSNTPSNGSYSIGSVPISAGDIVTVYIDGAAEKGVTVTRATNSGITGFDIYQSHVIVRHEDVGPISNADLSLFDSVGDSDIPFTISSGNLSVAAGSELHVWTGMEFTPGGSVTTASNNTATGFGGDVHVATGATLTLGSNALSVGGDFTNSGTVTISAGQTITMTGTTGNGFQITPGTLSFANLIFNGSGATWTAQATMPITENLTVTAGTFALGAHTLTIGSTSVSNSGSIMVASGQSLTQTSGSTTTVVSSAAGANCIGSTGASCSGTAGTMTFGGLTIGDGVTTFTSTFGATTPTITVANTLTITTNATLVAGASSLSVGASFTNSGTFTHVGGTLTMTGTGTLATGTATLNNFTVSGSGTVTLANATHTIAGNITFVSTKIITPGTSTISMTGTGAVLTAASRSLYRLTSNGSVSENGSLTITNALTVSSSKSLTIGGTVTITSASSVVMTGGTIDGSGTLTYQRTTSFPTDGTLNVNVRFSPTSGAATIPSRTYGGDVTCISGISPISCSLTGTPVINGNLDITALSIDTGLGGSPTSVTIGGGIHTNSDTAALSLTMSGSWTVHGDVDFSGVTSFIAGSGSTLFMDGNNATNAATFIANGANFDNLTLQPANGKTVTVNPETIFVNGNIVLGGSGTLTTTGSTFRINSSGKSLTSNGKAIGSLVINSGSFTLADAATLNADLTIGSASLTAPSTTLTINGNFSNGGTFTANGGTVNFAGSGTSTISGATTFNNITSTTAGKIIKFASATSGTPVFTVAGSMTLTGSTGSHISLSSTTPGSQWLPSFSLAQSSVTYTNILDSGCNTGTATVTLDATSINAGNNGACWSFATPTLTVNDGTGADATYSTSTTTLSANWAISDTTNVDHYEYAIGTTIGGTDVSTYTSTTLTTSVTRNGLSLSNGTTYYLTVRAINSFGVTMQQASSNGITVNTSLPTITDNQTGDTTPRNSAGTTYNVTFAKASTGAQLDLAEYTIFSGAGKTGTQLKNWTTIFSSTVDSYTTPWAIDFSALNEGVNYVSVRVHALDALTNETDDVFTITKDTTGPTLSAIVATPSMNSVVLTWTTNEPATTLVQYGLTATYGSSTILDSSLVTQHSATISGLAAMTAFHYQLFNQDQAGNLNTSTDATFSTTATPQTLITNVQATPISDTTVVISWTTNEAATSKVRYGLTTQYGSEVADATLVTSHRMTITGLQQNTLYHYEVLSTGSSTDSDADATFITSATPIISTVSAPTIENFTNGSTTADTLPYLTGSGPVNGAVFIVVDRKLVRTVPVDANGRYFVQLNIPLSLGQHAFVARARTVNGDLSDETTPILVTVVVPSPRLTVVSRAVTDGQRPTVTFVLKIPTNTNVHVLIDALVVQTLRVMQSALTTKTVTVTVVPSATLSVGKHTISFISYDAAGTPSLTTGQTVFYSSTITTNLSYGQSMVYTVQPNDSLWAIAEKFLGSGKRWTEIQRVNLTTHSSIRVTPQTIQPGWTLLIPAVPTR